jgi:hypothetical protein
MGTTSRHPTTSTLYQRGHHLVIAVDEQGEKILLSPMEILLDHEDNRPLEQYGPTFDPPGSSSPHPTKKDISHSTTRNRGKPDQTRTLLAKPTSRTCRVYFAPVLDETTPTVSNFYAALSIKIRHYLV